MEGSANTSGVDEGRNVGTGAGVDVENDSVGRTKVGSSVGAALCVAASAVPTVEMAVSIMSAWLRVGVDAKLLQAPSIPAKNKGMIVLQKIFTLQIPLMFCGGLCWAQTFVSWFSDTYFNT
jgi:hypothetical protein